MAELKTRITELKKIMDDYAQVVDLVGRRKKVEELELLSMKEDFWSDQESARKVMQELGNLKHEIEEFDSVMSDIDTLIELSEEEDVAGGFARDIARLESRVKKMELASFLSGKYDDRNAILSLHAGQGGTEAMDWCQMLARMYIRFCELRDWKYVVLDETPGEEAGIKSIVFKVVGKYAYGYLKNEAGTHRLVRQSPFNADNLRQTSFALLEVLPELDDVSGEVEIPESDLEWQFFRSSSQGGQNVQKVSTAVRVIHKPTGIIVTAQSERYQVQNRKNALDLLRAKLWVLNQEKLKNEEKGLKGDFVPASWGTQIRSYVLHPYRMVKDLRTNVETGDTDGVLDGKIDEFIDAEIKL